MDKPSFKLVGSPCGYHGQYTFYKAIRLTGKTERIVAIGDFFFVRVWQDSELVSIGELQLLWTDRVSDQTLVSLRLYFLPENTPDGRGQHGEDEVLAINDKVVLKAEDLLSWVSNGEDWRWGLRAVWRGACAPPADTKHTAPLHHTKLDFSDVEKEKDAIAVDEESPGVVVFSYPRYCRYRALVARLEGIQADWLRDSLVAALGGYSAPTKNTRILYCKDTFEYPELEGHEFVCNHLAPRVKGRGRPRRRRAHHDQDDRSSDDDEQPPRRPSLRPDKSSDEESDANATDEDRAFLKHLKHFYRDKDESFTRAMTLKDLSLRALYSIVTSKGGYDAVCRHKLWRVLFVDQPAHTRRHYERYLLPYERHEHRNGVTAAASGDGTLRHDVDSETGEIKEDMTLISKPAEELNREFLDSLPAEDKPAKISVRPVEMMVDAKGGDGGENQRGATESSFLKDMSMLHPPHNGHIPPPAEQAIRPSGRSSLRAVRVKPAHSRPSHTTTPTSSAPVTNFGIHRPPLAPPAATTHGAHSDDEIVEVPYKPKTPEIIDLDEYPESPQSVKKKKLDILKERGLEVTALPPPVWTSSPILTPQPLLPPTPLLTPTPPVLLNPAVQHQIMTNAQLFQMYNIIPPNYPNGVQPPKVIQGTSIFGSSNPEKTVYGNPKDPFMPPPHILLGAPIKPLRSVQAPQNPPQDILDLTCKINSKPAVEIVRVPPSQSPSKNIAQNLSKNFSIVDGKAVVGSNLEITLVNKSLSPTKSRPPLKRSSNGKFVSKTPTPPKDYPKPLTPKKNPIIVPNYQINENHSPSSSGSQMEPKAPMFLDPYMALYSLAGQMDPRQLAAYRDIMNNQVRGYPGFLNMGISNPTTKN